MTHQYPKPPISILHAYSKNEDGIINASFYLESSISERSRTDSSHSYSAFTSGPPVEQYDYQSTVDNFEDEGDQTSFPSYRKSGGSNSHGNLSHSSYYSSSTESDYVFGSENFGTFPVVHKAAPLISPAVVSCTGGDTTEEHADTSKSLENLPTLQKSAMAAYLASPTKHRWMDLVRTLRVEHRIASLGFTSLYDSDGSGDDDDDDDDDSVNSNIEKGESEYAEQREEFVEVRSIAQTGSRFQGANDVHRGDSECLGESATEHQFVTPNHRYPSSDEQQVHYEAEKAQGVVDGGHLDTIPNSNTGRGCPMISINTKASKIAEQQKNNLSFRVKSSMASFMEQPTQAHWLDLVQSFREDRTRIAQNIDHNWNLEWNDPDVDEGINKTRSSEMHHRSDNHEICEADWDVSRWPSFHNHAAINNAPNRQSLENLEIDQKSAMEAFMKQPSKDRWEKLVQSMRDEKLRRISMAKTGGSMKSDVRTAPACNIPTAEAERKDTQKHSDQTEEVQNSNKETTVAMQPGTQTNVLPALTKNGIDECMKMWEEWIHKRAAKSS